MRVFSTALSLFIFFSLFSQNKDCIKQKQKADALYEHNKYHDALAIYKELEKNCQTLLPDSNELNYKIGLCYFYSDNEREEAIRYLKRFISNIDSTVDAHYFLAKTYHYLNRFDEAIAEYEKFKHYVLNDTLQYEYEIIDKVIASIDNEIKRCNYGKSLINVPIDVVVENLGPTINTKYSEYAPVISNDEKLLVYTARYPYNKGGKISPDGDYFEDIYITEIKEGQVITQPKGLKKEFGFFSMLKPFKATKPQPISDEVNTKKHEGAVQFSIDNKKLYLYYDYNIWVSEYINGKWTKPHKVSELKNVLDEKAYEPSVSISQDLSLLFFSSDRKGGYGGLDIYMSKRRADGSWSEPENLGPVINTEFDEDGPYIDTDDRTLYFSSKGHTSMGGYDVFKTQFNGVYWSTPKNMGFPINSGGDDIFYMMTPILNRAYYSSNKAGGYGKMDIYRLTFAHEREPVAEVTGYVLEGDSLKPAQAKISIYTPDYQYKLYTQETDKEGKYLLIFDHGKDYAMRVETEGFVPYTKVFHIPPQVYYYQYYQEIHHVILKDKLGNVIGQKVEVYNNIFDNTNPPTDTLNIKDSVLQVNKIVDIKFYMSQDSLEKIIERDKHLDFEIPEYATVSFLKDSVLQQDTIITEEDFVPPSRSLPKTLQPQQNLRFEKLFTIRKILINVEENLTKTENVTLESFQDDSLNNQLKLMKHHISEAKKHLTEYKKIAAQHGENSTEAHYELEKLESELSAINFENQKFNNILQNIEDSSKENIASINKSVEQNQQKIQQGTQLVEEIFSEEFQQYTTEELLSETQNKIDQTRQIITKVYDVDIDIEKSIEETKNKIQEVEKNIDNLLSLYENYAAPEFINSKQYQVTIKKLLEAKYMIAQAKADMNEQQKNIPQLVKLIAETQRHIKETNKQLTQYIENHSGQLPPAEITTLKEIQTDLQSTEKQLKKYQTNTLQTIQKQDQLILKDIDTARYHIEKAERQFYHVEVIVKDTLVYDQIAQKKEVSKAMKNIKEAVEVSAKMLKMIERETKKVEEEVEELKNYLDTSGAHIQKIQQNESIKKQLKQTQDEVAENNALDKTADKQDAEPAQPIQQKFIIYFPFDKANIQPEEKIKLDSLADIMKTYPELKYKAVGHTDSKGSESYNLTLSKKRAQQAVNYMNQVYKISKNRFQIDYKGEAYPIAPNSFPDGSDNPEGRAKNRRVEFILMK